VRELLVGLRRLLQHQLETPQTKRHAVSLLAHRGHTLPAESIGGQSRFEAVRALKLAADPVEKFFKCLCTTLTTLTTLTRRLNNARAVVARVAKALLTPFTLRCPGWAFRACAELPMIGLSVLVYFFRPTSYKNQLPGGLAASVPPESGYGRYPRNSGCARSGSSCSVDLAVHLSSNAPSDAKYTCVTAKLACPGAC